MSNSLTSRLPIFLALSVPLILSGCPTKPSVKVGLPTSKLELSPHVQVESVGDRQRVVVEGEVCLRPEGVREYGLECLLCKRMTKEHESIFATDADPFAIHQALERIGAKAGSVMVYDGEFQTPAGMPLEVSVVAERDGKTIPLGASWQAPADTLLRMHLLEKDGADFVYTLPTYELPGGIELKASLSYYDNNKLIELPEKIFRAPEGGPSRIRFRYQLADRTVVLPPPFRAPTGAPIRVSVQFERDGRLVTEPVARLIRNKRTGKDLEHDWVFAGSIIVKDNPIDPDGPPQYLASGEGAIICVCNRPTAVLDLPVFNSKDSNEKQYELRTASVPPVGTPVKLILEPIVEGQ